MTTSLTDLIHEFEEREALQNADLVVNAGNLAMTAQGNIKTPSGAQLALTDWSRSQLSSLLGVKWDRWFSNASPEDRADEVNRRLGRMGECQLKIRSSRVPANEGEGVLDGIVTPAYSAIADSQVARLVAGALALHDDNLKVIRNFTTPMTTSYVIATGKPQGRGGVVGAMWGGVQVINSGVGYSCLSIQAHVTRLICSNGMKSVDTFCIKKRHRGIDMDKIAEGIFEAARRLPGVISRTLDMIDRSTSIAVGDVEADVRRLLGDAGLPLRHAAPIMRAYNDEPIRTAFGVSQAITAHARDVDAETRIELEAAAAAYLAGAVS